MGPDLQPAINVLADNCFVNDYRSVRNRHLKQNSLNRRRFGFHKGFLVEQVMDRGKSSSHNPDNPRRTEEESCIKNTMQMHEQIFKQQVRELHRLYNVQKLLMSEVKNQQLTSSLLAAATSSSETTSFINLPNKQPLQIRTQDPVKSFGNLDLERPCKEETAIDDDGKLLEDDQAVELTLGIGRKMDGKRCIDTQLLDSSLLAESDQGGQVGGSEIETSEGNREEEEKKQPFLFL